MKVIINIPDRQIQKVMILSGLNDSEMDKVNERLPQYSEIDITDFVANSDDANSINIAFASIALGAIAQLNDL